MSEIVEIIDVLEQKIEKLLLKINDLEIKNNQLTQQNTISISTIQSQNNAISQLKTDFESLKTANSLLGSEDYKRETKLKINSLIREIDYCISQLSE